MKKKILFITLILITITLTGLIVVKYFKSKAYKKSIYNISIVNYKQLALAKTPFYNKRDYNCFIIFNSNCEFCIDEIEDIVDNIELFKNINFYLVSDQLEEELIEYNEDSEFLDLENFTILHDKDARLLEFFGFPNTPSTYLYTKENKLINFKNGFMEYYSLKNMLE